MPRVQTGLYLDAEARAMVRRDKEMIPRRLVIAMFTLAAASLAITAYAVWTDKPHVGQPKVADVVAERYLVLDGTGQGAHVATVDGAILLDTDAAGFVAAVRQALDRERLKHRITDNPPVRLMALEGGRIALHDPATGWRAELASFGADNTAAWLPLLEGADG